MQAQRRIPSTNTNPRPLDTFEVVLAAVLDPVAYPNCWLCENGVGLGEVTVRPLAELMLVLVL